MQDKYQGTASAGPPKAKNMLGFKGLGRAKDHVTSVVNHDIEPPVLAHNALNRLIHRFLRGNIQFDGTEIDLILCRKLLCCFHLWRVPASGFAQTLDALRKAVSSR